MIDASAQPSFRPYSRWAHRGLLYWLGSPAKAVRAWSNVPVAVRMAPSADPRMVGRDSVVWFRFDRDRWGDRICLTFQSQRWFQGAASRWRALAKCLWVMTRRDPALVFPDVPVDINDDCEENLPGEVFGFARRRGTGRPLLPCPNLIRGVGRQPRPIPWEAKTDTLYFRGAETGSADLEANARITLCRVAAGIPGGDCRLSGVTQFTGEAALQLQREGLVDRKRPLADMNRHRYLVDCDGQSTSWDRYLFITAFGGVPIRFEPAWEECWHHLLVDGENCVVADRRTLGGVLAQLRAEPERARRIAANAARFGREGLGEEAVQAMFEKAWRERLGRGPR